MRRGDRSLGVTRATPPQHEAGKQHITCSMSDGSGGEREALLGVRVAISVGGELGFGRGVQLGGVVVDRAPGNGAASRFSRLRTPEPGRQ